MGIPQNIFAYTAPGADYPEFLSINIVDGEIKVTVRGPKWFDVEKGYDRCGTTVDMTLPREQLVEMLPGIRAGLIATNKNSHD